MENSLLILVLVAILFLSIYGFAYGSIALEKLKVKKAIQKELLLDQQRLEENARKQEIRDEKLRKVKKRRDEINHELKLLKQQKSNQAKMRAEK